MKMPGKFLVSPHRVTLSPPLLHQTNWLTACIQQHRPCRQDSLESFGPSLQLTRGHCNEFLLCGPFSALLSSFSPFSLPLYSTKPSVIIPAGARHLSYCCLYVAGSKLSCWESIMGGRVSCWASLRPELNLQIFTQCLQEQEPLGSQQLYVQHEGLGYR